jgi:glycosyltransferase involved in cell wall biosynthesis
MSLNSPISLVTPVYNGAEYIQQAMDSVGSQQIKPTEYIVCDGGSTDGTLQIAEENRPLVTQILHGPDRGMYDALNKGFQASTGDILGWINSDDILLPWCLSAVLKYFQLNPQAEWVTGIPAVFDRTGCLVWVAQVAPYYKRSWIAQGWYSGIGLGIIQQECTFWRRSLFERVGGLNADLRWGGDLDLWRRFAASGAELHQIGTVVSGFRKHGSNASATHFEQYHREGGARRIRGGKILGYSYSYLRFLIARMRNEKRLADCD